MSERRHSDDEVAEIFARASETERTAQRQPLGLPLGVARTVRLSRRMTDTEWERLVVDLRETFDARGVIRTDGSLRQWSNGNLQVLVEPDGEGDRVRFRTLRGQSRSLMVFGLGAIGVGAADGRTRGTTRVSVVLKLFPRPFLAVSRP